MTQKELSYIEDAIGHEKNIISICKETNNYLQDETLKNFIESEITKHEETKNNLINMLGGKANE